MMQHNRIEYGSRFYIDLEQQGRVARITDRRTGAIVVVDELEHGPGSALADAVAHCRRELEVEGRLATIVDRMLEVGGAEALLVVDDERDRLLGYPAGAEGLEELAAAFRAGRSRRRRVHVVEQRLEGTVE